MAKLVLWNDNDTTLEISGSNNRESLRYTLPSSGGELLCRESGAAMPNSNMTWTGKHVFENSIRIGDGTNIQDAINFKQGNRTYVKNLNRDIQWTVGEGTETDTHFNTLNRALAKATEYKAYNREITITLNSGYLINETIKIVNADLRHVKIVSVDDWVVASGENFENAVCSSEHQNEKTIFTIFKSFAPYIGFKLDIQTTLERVSGYTITNTSDFNILPNMFGIRGVSGFGINCCNGSRCSIDTARIEMKTTNTYSSAVLLDNSAYGVGYNLEIYNIGGRALWVTQGSIGCFSLALKSVNEVYVNDNKYNYVFELSVGSLCHVEFREIPANLTNKTILVNHRSGYSRVVYPRNYVKGNEIASNMILNQVNPDNGIVLTSYSGAIS